MTLRNTNVDFKNIKSYATLKGLEKALEAESNLYPEFDDRYIIVKTPDDRWTAIVMLDKFSGGYIGRYPFLKV